MTFCRSVYVKKVMKLLAFIFEQPSYKDSAILNRVLEFHLNLNWAETVTYIFNVHSSCKNDGTLYNVNITMLYGIVDIIKNQSGGGMYAK